MTKHELVLRDVLAEHADGVADTTPPVDRLLRAGRRSRRRRAAIGAAAGATALAGVTAIGFAAFPDQVAPTPGVPAGKPSPTQSPEVSGPPTSPSPTAPTTQPSTTPCSEIPRLADLAQLDDLVVDPEAGLLSFTYVHPGGGEARTYTVAYKSDATCREHPEVNQLIKRVESDLG